MDVLSLIPPGVTYAQHREPSGTNTKSVFRRTPTEVVEWDDFLEKVASYKPFDTPMYEKKNFDKRHVASESDICSALDRNVYEMLGLLASSQEHFNSDKAIETIGEPDRIFYNDDPLLLLVIEVKTKYTLPINDDNDLIRKFNEDTQVHDQNLAPINSTLYQVQQIFGYLSCNCLQYGVLTTYEQTWFLKRDLGKLYISSAIRYNNQNPTLFHCYACIMDLARRGHSNPSAPSPTQPDSSPSNHSDPNDSDYNPRKKHKRGGDDSSGSKCKQHDGGSSESKQKKGHQGS